MDDEPTIVYAVCAEQPGPPLEVYAVFDSEEEARRHVDAAYYMFQVVPVRVYRSYDDCPEAQRYTDSGNAPASD